MTVVIPLLRRGGDALEVERWSGPLSGHLRDFHRELVAA
jgi:hypothetical protein